MLKDTDIKKKAKRFVKKEVPEPTDSNEPVRIALSDGYIAGYKQCETDYERWRVASINSQNNYY